MNQFDWVQIISLAGFLILAGSALIGQRLSWKKGFRFGADLGRNFHHGILVHKLGVGMIEQAGWPAETVGIAAPLFNIIYIIIVL